MGIFTKKRRIELVNGDCLLDYSSKFQDNPDGSVTLKSRWGRPTETFRPEAIVRDVKESFFDNFTCESKCESKSK